MSARIGIHVEGDSARAVYVRGAKVLAVWSAAGLSPESMRPRLGEMFRAFPRAWPRPRVTIALAPPWSRRKVLTGLPELVDRDDVIRLVRENAPRFFVGDPSRFVVAAVPKDGVVIAEAYDRQVSEALAQGVEPGTRHLQVTSTMSIAGLEAPSAHVLGSFGEGYRTAYLATRLDPGGIPVFEPVVRSATATPRWRVAFVAAAFALALVALVTSPVLAARRVAAEASSELQSLAPRYRAALSSQRVITALETDLATVGALHVKRPSALRSLELLTRALPQHSALLSLSIDTAGGTVVAASERIADVIASLDSLPDIRTPQVIGPITRERFGNVERDRATVRFTWSNR